MANKLSEIITPEYGLMLPRWTEYRRLVESGQLLADCLPQEDNEDNNSWRMRRQHCVDLVGWSKTLQKQIDILTLAGVTVHSEDAQLGKLLSGEQQPGVDGKGSSLVQFLLNDVLKQALIYQRVFVVVDRMAGLPSDVTMAQLEQLPTPYTYVMAPDMVQAVVWESTASESIKRIIFKTQQPTKYWESASGQLVPKEYMWRWVEWTPEFYRMEDEKGNEVFSAPNALGRVPILAFTLNDSLLRDMYLLTLEIMNHYSLAGSGAAKQVYGLPVICSDKVLDNLNLTQGLLLGKGDSFELHQSPVEGLQFNIDMVEKLQQQIDKTLSSRIYSMSVKAVEQSGASKRMDNVCQENFSSYLADQILRFAPILANMFGAYFGRNDVAIRVQAPDQYVTQDRDADRTDAAYFSTQFQPATTLQWIAQQKAIRKLSGLEANMTHEEIQQDNDELSAKAKDLFTEQPISDGLERPNQGGGADESNSQVMAKNDQGNQNQWADQMNSGQPGRNNFSIVR